MALGALLVAAGLAYWGAITYLTWRESTAPSTSTILRLRDGSQLPLVQPTPAQPQAQTQAQAGTKSPEASDGSMGKVPSAPVVTTSTTQEVPPAFLPPLDVAAPAIGVKWPVVLATNEHMPKFRGVGWLLGSGYPGMPGNVVLFGH